MPYRVSKNVGGEKKFLLISNGGINDKSIFRTSADYRKFLSILSRLSRHNSSVGIVGYCLLRNHYCIIAEERQRGSVSKFIHKLTTAYVTYFQYKYDHKGKLFQGPFKDLILEDIESVVMHLSKMHLLPIKFNQDYEIYPWSSYLKYFNNQAPWLFKQPLRDYFNSDNISLMLRDFTNTVPVPDDNCGDKLQN